MCVCKTAIRRRRQIKLDPRYGGWRKSGAARDKKLAQQREKERVMQLRKNAGKK